MIALGFHHRTVQSPAPDPGDAGSPSPDAGAVDEPAPKCGLDDESRRRFERLALPHLDAAFNLARWLVRNDADASDIVQDAFLRAMRAFAGVRGESARPWLLAVVRNTAFTWLRKNRPPVEHVAYDEDLHGDARNQLGDEPQTPEQHALRTENRLAVNDALARLPVELREAIVLRELEDLSYRQIAEVQAIPIGTVMSRLSRARQLLGRYLRQELAGGGDELR